ncbi:uncharacterized protein Dyak_GE11224 [Drosophila yakuba]|uniref:Uncharacterized protein n=1 Tax=Drosophila yakuba TaxID=7245 RepID=B4IV21_DROYA|nr:uncharacterized protein Dyak_GE11224 [Drosophila yakuba]
MSAVKRWIYRHTHSSSSATPPVSPTNKTRRGRSHSLDVQSLPGIRAMMVNNRAAAHQQQLAVQSKYEIELQFILEYYHNSKYQVENIENNNLQSP